MFPSDSLRCNPIQNCNISTNRCDIQQTTIGETLEAAEEALGKAPETVVADKVYHSGGLANRLEEHGQQAVIPKPKRPERKWQDGQEAEWAAVESTRKRLASENGRDLLRLRAEKVERSMADMYETDHMTPWGHARRLLRDKAW